jgi:hypothetical protein
VSVVVSVGPVGPELSRLGERLLGSSLVVGRRLMYLLWAVVADFSVKWTLPT